MENFSLEELEEEIKRRRTSETEEEVEETTTTETTRTDLIEEAENVETETTIDITPEPEVVFDDTAIVVSETLSADVISSNPERDALVLIEELRADNEREHLRLQGEIDALKQLIRTFGDNTTVVEEVATTPLAMSIRRGIIQNERTNVEKRT